MGWNLDLTADKDISVDDVRSVVESLPEELHGPLGISEQSWGWSCVTDINRPKGKVLSVSGAWYSVKMAEEVADTLSEGLREFGYKMEKDEVRG